MQININTQHIDEQTYGETRYFIGPYFVYEDVNAPYIRPYYRKHPYPLDMCIIYVEYLNDSPKWGMFTCNDNGDKVTFTEYGKYGCWRPVRNFTFVYNSSIPNGALFKFNCHGETNYVSSRVCNSSTGDAGDYSECCSLNNCVTRHTATNVCVRNRYGYGYTMYVK